MTARNQVFAQIGTIRGGSGSAKAAQASAKMITDKLSKILQSFKGVAEPAMMEALEPTFQITQDWCPTATGKLKSSGYLAVAEFRGEPRVEIGYGKGGVPEYAPLVHERVEVHHKAPTRAKWLEQGVLADTNGIMHRIQLAYARHWKSLGG